MDAETAVERLRHAFRGRDDGIAAAYLFGIIARGDSRSGMTGVDPIRKRRAFIETCLRETNSRCRPIATPTR